MKYYKVVVLSLVLIGCSISSAGPSRSHKAYEKGDYPEAIRLVDRALNVYEYTDEDKANLYFIKANSYLKLNEKENALGTLTYITEQYPETESAYKSVALLESIEK